MDGRNTKSVGKGRSSRILLLLFMAAFLCVFAIGSGCGNKPTDLRTLVPADTLVYLEANDLGEALRPIANSRSFQAVDGSKPDFSSTRGVQLAIAILSIETSEQKLNGEQSAAAIKPKFVAVIETHAWNFQAVRFAEGKLGGLVERFYGSKPQMETTDQQGGRNIVWTAADGRKAFASVIDSLVYFSNDRETLDRTLAVRSGAASLASTGKVQVTPGAIASGYASTAGVAQLADIAGLRMATSASDPQARSAVALILPQLIREMVTEVRWAAMPADGGVMDAYSLMMPENVTSALKDTQPGDLQVRLRNAVVALLADSKLDPATRTQVADLISSISASSDGTQISFTENGVERKTVSETGLIGSIASQLVSAQ